MTLHYQYEVVIVLYFWLPRNKDVKLYKAVRACTNKIIYAKFSLMLDLEGINSEELQTTQWSS